MERKARIRALGLTQRLLAERLGVNEEVVSRYVRGVEGAGGGYLPAVLDALELMTPDQRSAWLTQLASAVAEPALAAIG